MELKNHYKILGVTENADIAQIKAAYRKLARKYHPDVSSAADAEARFKEIGETYAVLKDPRKRAEYDLLRSINITWSEERFRAPSTRRANTKARSTRTNTHPSGDFFEPAFGNSVHADRTDKTTEPARSFRVRGMDIHHKISLSLEDAQRESQQQITLRVPVSGAGGALTYREKTFNVKIPAGVTPGQRIRLAGQGAPSPDDGDPGDLFLEVELTPPPHLSIAGKDILLTLPVTAWETAVGATVEVPTWDGRIKLKIPPGSSHGDQLRIQGKGLAGTPAGDQLVTLEVVSSMAAIINSWRYEDL